MILIIDNYDSFVYNLARYINELGMYSIVKRNDQISIEEIKRLSPSHIILSPGPCTPNEAGICLDIINELKGLLPILGVCLGHQVIGQAFGGNIIHANFPVHGKASIITHNSAGIFYNLPTKLNVARYHSLIIDPATLPECLKITATTNDSTIMAIEHKRYEIFGVQFHPESILTEHGKQLLRNFCSSANMN